VYRLIFNSKELASKSFLQLRMKITSLLNGIKSSPRELQVINHYTKLMVLYAINLLSKKGGKSDISSNEIVNLSIYKSYYRNLEMGEY
jgi:hypothetical protein